MNVKNEITSRLKAVVADLALQGETLERVEQVLQTPKDENHGDYSSNIAMILWGNKELRIKNPHFAKVSRGKQEYKSPLELAQKIADKFIIHNSKFMILERVEAVKPGFINFWLSKEYLMEQLKEVVEKGDRFGSKTEDLNKKVVVEYSSPNIAKPFTVGHLRSTIIGDAVANLLEANGWRVYRDNHIGDWGTQFGKQIYAIKKWGNEEEIGKADNPVKELVNLYVKFHAETEKDPTLEKEGRVWFKKLEDGESEARRLWKKCVEWSLKEFENIYEKFEVKFTENNGLGYGESFFEDKIKDILEELNSKKLLKESEGAKLVFFSKDRYPPLMIVKKDGATLYATRDLATDKFRLKKYGKDVVIINEVGIEQSLYFRQLYELEKMLGWVKDGQRIHIKHGHYRFKDEKMSTRKGNTIWLEDVLEEAVNRAEKLGSEGKRIAEKVGIGALKWNDLKRGSSLDIVFDWDEILNMQGNSGPYLQYAYARTQSVLSNAKLKVDPSASLRLRGSDSRSSGGKLKNMEKNSCLLPLASQLAPEETSLLRALSRFPEIVEEAAEKFSPNLLCNYLFDTAQKFNLFYQKVPIIKNPQVSIGIHPRGVHVHFRVALTMAVGQVIKNGLHLLGISAPQHM